MNPKLPRYSPDEFARRGQDIYDRVVVPALRPEDDGKFVAIDIESSDFEIDAKGRPAADRLLARHPDAQIWLVRAGRPTAYQFGRRLAGVGGS